MSGLLPTLAIVSSAVFAASVVWAIVRPPRSLAARVRPYSLSTRVGLRRSTDAFGQATAGPVFGEGTVRRLFAPIIGGVIGRLGRLVSSLSDDQLTVKLRQSGLYPETPETMRAQEYRIRSVGRAVVFGGGIGMFGLLLFRNAFGVVLFGSLGFLLGMLLSRSLLDGAITRRRERIRSELYTVNQLIAMRTRVGGGAVEATRHVVDRANGAVVDELAEALRLHERGWSFTDALQRAAELSPEPEAQRCYRVIATSQERGADLADALLDLAKDLRTARRDEMQARAAKQRLLIVIPIVIVLAPVILWFLGAPLPSIIFGG